MKVIFYEAARLLLSGLVVFVVVVFSVAMGRSERSGEFIKILKRGGIV